MSAHCYDSICSTMLLCKSILGSVTFDLAAHIETVQFAKSLDGQLNLNILPLVLTSLLNSLIPYSSRECCSLKISICLLSCRWRVVI